MTVLIDADSLIYVIGYWHRDFYDETAVKNSCDNMLAELMTLTQGEDYIAVFSDRSFRHDVYKYRPYKGNRKEKPEWYDKWADTIKGHFIAKHHFFTIKGLEADDVIIAAAELFRQNDHPCIISSPDKDLRNFPGLFYVPRTGENGEVSGSILTVDEADAHHSFWEQMLCGDSTDNVAGVPGMGPAKVAKLFAECLDPIQYKSCVQGCYQKYFGDYYGNIIFNETYQTLLMMREDHPLYDNYRMDLALVPGLRRPLLKAKGFFDV